jgi:hypothetical protein
MPETTITIDRDQRGGLYELVRNHLSSIEDFWVALKRTKDFATAERLGLEFAEDFRLLQDIGWSEYDVRESYRADDRDIKISKSLGRPLSMPLALPNCLAEALLDLLAGSRPLAAGAKRKTSDARHALCEQ